MRFLRHCTPCLFAHIPHHSWCSSAAVDFKLSHGNESALNVSSVLKCVLSIAVKGQKCHEKGIGLS